MPSAEQKERVVSAHSVEHQALVGLEHLPAKAGVAERELEALLVELHAGTGRLP